MTWNIPVTWIMTGTQQVTADRLEDAMDHACDNFDPVDSEFADGSLELDCDDVEAVRAIYNHGMPDYLDREYPELAEYRFEEGRGYCRDIPRASEEFPTEYWSEYEIIFDVVGNRYYFFCLAKDMDRAVATFFRLHPNITYNMIVDHVEV